MKTHLTPPFAPSIIKSIRFVGYTIETAIADIIDNSITANAKNISIFYDSVIQRIMILDDGYGMSSTELRSAMTYGYDSTHIHNKDYGLGRYGLGLKTASLSLCKKLIVISKKNDQISCYSWDIDYVESTGNWDLIEYDTHEIDKTHLSMFDYLSSGTLVIWEKLDKILNDSHNYEKTLNNHFISVRTHLQMVFHRYLNPDHNTSKISIKIQENPLQAFDPFLINKSTVREPEMLPLYDEKHTRYNIEIVSYTLPHISKMSNDEIKMLGGGDNIAQNQGFYLYREKRLILYGGWFGLVKRKDLYKLSRVRIDIPRELDYLWNLDIKKSSIHPPVIVIEGIKKILDKILDLGERVTKFRAKKETNNENEKIWEPNETRYGHVYTLNRNHPILRVCFEEDNPKHEMMLKLIENEIPIHQIIMDTNDDKQFAYDHSEYKKAIYIEQMKFFMGSIDQETRILKLDYWLNQPPFDQFDFTENDKKEIIGK